MVSSSDSCHYGIFYYDINITIFLLYLMIFFQFGILLLILVVVELGCSIWSVVIWDTMKDNVTQTIENEFSAAIIGKEEDSIKRWEKIQNDVSLQLYLIINKLI